MEKRLKREFYLKNGIDLAKDLLGKILVKRQGKQLLKGRIVETEAYMGFEDKASHAYQGKRTERTEAMYNEGGYSYIYMIYGMYNCLNVTANIEGNAEAVLIRALEPLEGTETMLENRPVKKIRDLCSGPGKLCMALGIDRSHNKIDLVNSEEMWIEEDGCRTGEIVETQRIGIAYAQEYAEKPWRFYIKDNAYISKI